MRATLPTQPSPLQFETEQHPYLRATRCSMLARRYGADIVIEDGTAACNATLDHDVVKQMMGVNTLLTVMACHC